MSSPGGGGVLRIASRGSALALWQAGFVEAALRRADPALEVEVRIIRTTGDRVTDVPLARIGDRGLFTKEIDDALLAGHADLAVHSMKDVPTRLPDGLAIAAIGEREDPRDVLVLPGGAAGGLDALAAGARVGTSSLRRRAQLRALRPDLEVVDLRGNLDTRLAKVDRGECDAAILAAAGLLRLGWEERVSAPLDAPAWLPAVGQGALAVVTRAGDRTVVDRVRAGLHHAETSACVLAERAFLRRLEGGCQVPVGALGVMEGGRLRLHGLVAHPDGSPVVRGEDEGAADEAEALGLRLAEALIARGADEVLAHVRAENPAVPEPAAP